MTYLELGKRNNRNLYQHLKINYYLDWLYLLISNKTQIISVHISILSFPRNNSFLPFNGTDDFLTNFGFRFSPLASSKRNERYIAAFLSNYSYSQLSALRVPVCSNRMLRDIFPPSVRPLSKQQIPWNVRRSHTHTFTQVSNLKNRTIQASKLRVADFLLLTSYFYEYEEE